MRIANYARYSSENQRETSIADQFHLGDVRAERDGWPIALRFSDSSISASVPTLLRPGGRALMEAIRAGQIDILLIESLDRCWRDIVDQERTIREIEDLGVRIIGISDGYDSNHEGRELQRVVIGGVNQQYLRDLGKKVHRGLTGQTRRGYHAGGLSYGYRSVVVGYDAKGEPVGHRLEINEDQARWVRWIYARYLEGWSPRKIVYALNQQGVPSPRGHSWAIGALYGQPQYGTGILRNELYRGRYIWNRSQWVRVPDQRIRKRKKQRDRQEWLIRDCPELLIVSEETWLAVQAKLSGPKRAKPGKPKRTLLSGVLRCEHCGGAVTAVDKYAYGCAAAKDRGPAVCSGVRISRPVLEKRIMDIVRAEIFDEGSIAELRREVAAIQASADREQADQGRAAKARLAPLEREIANLVEAVAVAGWSDALSERLKAAEAERATLQASLSATPPDPLPATFIPRLVEHYRAMVDNLPTIAQRDPQAAREALQELLGEVRLSKDGDGAVWVHVPDLGDLLLNMVAGDRFYHKKSTPRPWKLYRVASYLIAAALVAFSAQDKALAAGWLGCMPPTSFRSTETSDRFQPGSGRRFQSHQPRPDATV